MPRSKQIQKGNIKGHLGDEKGNCCTWQYTYRHIHLGMYTHTSIYIPPQICYIYAFKHLLLFYQSGVRPESRNAQSLYSAALYSQSFTCLTTVSRCCSHFLKHINLASLILEKLLAKRQQVCSALCSQLLSKELHVCFRPGKFLDNSYTFYFRDFLPGQS